jgi:hypothetical protein
MVVQPRRAAQSAVAAKEPEASHDETESHESQAGANPSEQRSLGGQIIAKVTSLLRFHLTTVRVNLPQ